MFLRQSFQCKFLTVLLLTGSTFHSAACKAEVWANVRDMVITNNGVTNDDATANACTQCHSYINNLAGGAVEPAPLSRHQAPVGVDFDGASDLDAYNNATAVC
jgi:hypothetical protein